MKRRRTVTWHMSSLDPYHSEDLEGEVRTGHYDSPVCEVLEFRVAFTSELALRVVDECSYDNHASNDSKHDKSNNGNACSWPDEVQTLFQSSEIPAVPAPLIVLHPATYFIIIKV